MNKVGDLAWHQISRWSFSPKNCIEKFEVSKDGKHNFHFVLHRTTEIIAENHWKHEVVNTEDGLPKEFLNEERCTYYLKKNNKSTKIEKNSDS